MNPGASPGPFFYPREKGNLTVDPDPLRDRDQFDLFFLQRFACKKLVSLIKIFIKFVSAKGITL